MTGFCAVFNCSNRADKEKDKSIHRFRSVVKNNTKEGLKPLKAKREKWLAPKARKNKDKNQNNTFCLTFIGFFTQSWQYQIWKANTYSILTNGNQTWTTSVGVLN